MNVNASGGGARFAAAAASEKLAPPPAIDLIAKNGNRRLGKIDARTATRIGKPSDA